MVVLVTVAIGILVALGGLYWLNKKKIQKTIDHLKEVEAAREKEISDRFAQYEYVVKAERLRKLTANKCAILIYAFQASFETTVRARPRRVLLTSFTHDVGHLSVRQHRHGIRIQHLLS